MIRASIMVASLLACVAPAAAQERSATRPGFAFAPDGGCILLFRPEISVGAQSTGGLFEPDADWTQQAREKLGAGLAAAQANLGHRVVVADDPVGAAAERLAAYRSLFKTVAGSVIEFQFFKGNRLPTKKRDGQFDWTLGPGTASLAGDSGCGYALFIATEDAFGSTGRKMLQVFAALARVPVTSGVHKGFAGLVELKTGDLVWLNADYQMGGDVRVADGAAKRVGQLLDGFPGRAAAR